MMTEAITRKKPGNGEALDPPRYQQIFESLRSRIGSGDYGPGAKLPTEAELMHHFDVSRTTVSRAMRDLEQLGLVTRRRGSGTYVNRVQSQGERTAFCLFAPWVQSGDKLPYIEGLIYQRLADLANQTGDSMSLQCVRGGPGSLTQRAVDAVQSIIDSDVKGVLYYPAEVAGEDIGINRRLVDLLVDAGRQVVLVDRDIVPAPERSEFHRIGYDNQRGGMLLTDHLFQVGAKRIAFVGIPEVSTAVAQRLSGYFEAHRIRGHEVDPALVVEADPADLTPAFCRDLIEGRRADAIIGKMDRYAAIIGRHLTTMGLKIGVDVKLAGFDNDPIAELLPVPLTTINLPVDVFAEAAFEAIASAVRQSGARVLQTIIDVELVPRGSTVLSE